MNVSSLCDFENDVGTRAIATARATVAVRDPHGDLLPTRIPRLPGMQIAARRRAARDGVSGDFLGLAPTGSNGYAIVLGDVCGNGAQAASVAAAAQHTLRAAERWERAPCRILGFLNSVMLTHATDSERFLTAVYLTLQPWQTRDWFHAALCSAGHPPILVRRRDGTVRPLGSGGIALGVTADPQLADSHFILRRGDTILLYTDGITEASRDGERYGEERLRVLFSRIGGLEPPTVVRQIERAAINFGRPSGPSSGRDDTTILVLRIR